MNMNVTVPFRGVSAVRNDAGNATKILAELQKTFEDFKQERDKEMADIKKNLADVVQTEKVDRMNDEITSLNTALAEIASAQAALQVGGVGEVSNPDVAAHATAFNQFFRKGADNDLRDLEVKAKLTTGSDPDGGFLVPEETETEIDRVLGTVSTVRSLARVMQISSDTYKKLVNVGGTGSGWVGEEETRPKTDGPSLREIVVNCHEIYANPATTQRMLDDARIDIASWLAEEVATEFAEQEGSAFISGSGALKPRGLLTYDTVVNSSYEWGKIGYTPTGAAAAFASTAPADALLDLYFSLKAGHRNNASWLMSDVVQGKTRKFKDGDGNYLWKAPSDTAELSTILGKPVSSDDNMPNVAANSLPIAFGDFRRGYLIVDRFGIRVLRDPFTEKPNVLFYTTKRVGGGVTNFEAIKLLKVATS